MARNQQTVRVLSEVGHCEHTASGALDPVFDKNANLWIGVCARCRKPVSLCPTTVWPELPPVRKTAKTAG